MASTLEENLVPFSSSFISIKLLHHVQSSNLLIIPHVKPELGSPNISIVGSGVLDVNDLKSLLINVLCSIRFIRNEGNVFKHCRIKIRIHT